MCIRRLMFLLSIAIFAAVVVAFGVGLIRDSRPVPSPMTDKPAPALKLPALFAGEPGLSNADLQGQVSLINVFASWCVPCRIEHPSIMRLAHREGVAVFGINYKDRPEDAKAWLAKLGNPYRRIGVDADGRTSVDWGVQGLPETMVIDRAGRIRYRYVGVIQERDVEETLLPVIRKLESAANSGTRVRASE